MIGLMALIISVSTLTSGIMQMNRRVRKVEQEFVIGEKEDGLSISRDLATRESRAKNILLIAQKYVLESDSEYKEIQKNIATLSEEKSKHELYEANENLQTQVDSLCSRLTEMGMNTDELQALNEEKAVFDNAMNTIQCDPYNQWVSEYEQDIDTVPGTFFSWFTHEVEYFK